MLVQVLDEELMEKKKAPEELIAETMNIVNDCHEESGEELMDRVRDLQNQFDGLSENCYESKELCEEATSAMQVITHVRTHAHTLTYMYTLSHTHTHTHTTELQV